MVITPMSKDTGQGMMKLTVNITPQDITRFSEYFFDTSKTIKNAVVKNQIILRGSPLVGGIISVFMDEMSLLAAVIVLLVMFVCFSLPIYVVYPKYHKRKYQHEMNKLYSEGANKGIYGQHEYTIDDDGLLEQTAVNVTKQQWSSIEKVVQHRDNTYIFISAIHAHVLPKSSVIEGDYESFVAELTNKITNESLHIPHGRID